MHPCFRWDINIAHIEAHHVTAVPCHMLHHRPTLRKFLAHALVPTAMEGEGKCWWTRRKYWRKWGKKKIILAPGVWMGQIKEVFSSPMNSVIYTDFHFKALWQLRFLSARHRISVTSVREDIGWPWRLERIVPLGLLNVWKSHKMATPRRDTRDSSAYVSLGLNRGSLLLGSAGGGCSSLW